MKIALIAVAVALTMAFCTKEKTAVVHSTASSKIWPYSYYTFIGENHNYLQMQDPTYYVKSDSPFPDCFNTMGHTYCSIKAMGDAWIEGQPDLNTVISWWYRPL